MIVVVIVTVVLIYSVVTIVLAKLVKHRLDPRDQPDVRDWPDLP